MLSDGCLCVCLSCNVGVLCPNGQMDQDATWYGDRPQRLLPLRRYKAKRVKTRCYQERVGHLKPRFQGKGSSQGNIFLLSTKL